MNCGEGKHMNYRYTTPAYYSNTVALIDIFTSLHGTIVSGFVICGYIFIAKWVIERTILGIV